MRPVVVGRLSHRPSGQYPCWWLQAGAGVSCPGVGLQQQGHAMNKTIPASHVRIKRAYEAPMPEDGARILIDRLWPRGVKKEALLLTEWAKMLAPSTALRQWFNHDPALWDEFRRRYAAELRAQRPAFDALRERARHGVVTLVYSAHDEAVNNAVAMRDFLLQPGGLDAAQ